MAVSSREGTNMPPTVPVHTVHRRMVPVVVIIITVVIIISVVVVVVAAATHLRTVPTMAAP